MFEWLCKFNEILVTGPQRSGTRICAKMIAHDTGYEYVDEELLEMDSMLSFGSFIRSKGAVIQCPTLCRHIHMFAREDTAIVLMRRSLEDIIASQQRIGWQWEWLELARYDRSDGIIAEVKYKFWDERQKEKIKHAFEVEYENLSTHPLWVAEGLRRNFNVIQTTYPNQSLVIDQKAQPLPYSGVHCSSDKLEQGSAILFKTKENFRVLNETGQFIWNLCDGAHTRKDILEALQKEYNNINTDELLSDLDVFISDLVTNGFLRLDMSEATTDVASD